MDVGHNVVPFYFILPSFLTIVVICPLPLLHPLSFCTHPSSLPRNQEASAMGLDTGRARLLRKNGSHESWKKPNILCRHAASPKLEGTRPRDPYRLVVPMLHGEGRQRRAYISIAGLYRLHVVIVTTAWRPALGA